MIFTTMITNLFSFLWETEVWCNSYGLIYCIWLADKQIEAKLTTNKQIKANKAILNSQSYCFADDTHLLNISNFPKKVQKQLNIDLKLLYTWNIRLNGHKLLLSDEVLDKYLNGYYQSKMVMQKLTRALGMFSKVRHYFAKTELKSIYHTLFESYLTIINLIQNLSKIELKNYKRKLCKSLYLQITGHHLHLYIKN